MEYGNSPRILIRVAIVGLCLGVFACVAGIVGALAEGRWNLHRWAWFLLLLFTPPVALLFAVTLTLPFRIRIHAGRVQHVLFGQHVLSDYPLADYLKMRRFSHGCAAVLEFRGGHRIHFFGAHMSEIARLARDLSARKDHATLSMT